MLFVLLFSPYFRYLPLGTVLQKSITARLDGIVNPSIHPNVHVHACCPTFLILLHETSYISFRI